MDQKDKHGENNMLNSFKNFQKKKTKNLMFLGNNMNTLCKKTSS